MPALSKYNLYYEQARHDRTQVVSALVEGNSLRGTARITGVARMTVEKLLRDLGYVCAMYQDVALRDLPCKRIQVDEIWSFVYTKQKNRHGQDSRSRGLTLATSGHGHRFAPIPSLSRAGYVGGRDAGYATEFMQDLAGRLAGRVQLTSREPAVSPGRRGCLRCWY